jgi:hypothetical protein
VTTRGLRNFNPGNIRHGDPWVGLAPTQDDPSFCTFVSPEYGIRAMAKILLSYKAAGIHTIEDAVHRWAPPNENETDAYVHDVSLRTGIEPTELTDLAAYTTCKNVIKAIIFHENGHQPYSDEVISKGLALAGIEP